MAKVYPWDTGQTSTPKVTGVAVSDINLLRNIISTGQSASQNYDPKTTGFLNNIISRVGAALNVKGSEKGVALRSDIADIRTAMRNYISGAAVSKYEAKELEDLIPKPGESDVKVKEKLRKLQERSIRKVGNVLQTAGIDTAPEQYLNTSVVTPQDNSKQFNLVDWLKNTSSAKYAQDIGQALGIRSKDWQGEQDSLNNARNMVRQLQQRVMIETDPEKKQRLLDLAREQSEKLGQISQEGQPKFSEDIDKPYLQRGLEVGSEIALAAEGANMGANLIKNTAKIASKIPTGTKKITEILKPGSKPAKLFEEGAKEATQKYINGDKIINKLEKALTDPKYSVTERGQMKTIVESLKNDIGGTKLSLQTVRDMFIEHSGGRTVTGVVRSGGEALYDRLMRQTIREEVNKIGANKIISAIETAAKNKEVAKQWKWLIDPRTQKLNIGGLSSKVASDATMALILRSLGLGGDSDR